MKTKLTSLKNKIKQNAPVIATSIVAVIASAAALYYRNELDKETSPLGSDEWPTIHVSPRLMEKVANGATLKYREIRTSPTRLYTQSTTNEEFSKEQNEIFENPDKIEF